MKYFYDVFLAIIGSENIGKFDLNMRSKFFFHGTAIGNVAFNEFDISDISYFVSSTKKCEFLTVLYE